MKLRLVLVLLAATAAPPRLATAQQTPIRTLSLEQYLDMEGVSNPQISPDGTQIIYSRSWIDKVNDSDESSIWIMNADGSRARFLADGSSPQWSPDGSRIAYTAQGEPEGSQIYVRWMDAEGATTQITRLAESPSGLQWSPDGTSIAFTMRVPSEPEFSVSIPGDWRPEGADWTDAPKVVTRPDYRADRRGFVDDGYTHVFVVPAIGGTPRQLTDGDYDHGDVAWMPDGGEILFSSHRVPGAAWIYRESEIYGVSLEDGRIRQLTTRRGPDGNPLPSPDGSLIAYTGDDFHEETHKVDHVYVMEPDGSNARMISGDWDRSYSIVDWAQDGSGLFMNVDREGTANVYFLPLDGSGAYPLTEGYHMLSLESFADGLAVGEREAFHEPGDVVTFDLRAALRSPVGEAGITQITHVNDDVLAGITLGEVEEVWYKSVDDFDIQGWIIKPPDFDPSRDYPLILAIHGGPHGMYDVGFSFGWQDHAANGYVVLYTNPRGSTGYGSAFGNSIKYAYPGKDFDDLMNGVDEVIERGYIDTNNLFVYGCSGGGVLTSWIVGHTDRFAAASANCPVTNWLSFVGTTDGIGWYRDFEDYPWEDPSEHLRRSPLMYAGNVNTPTMLMTGENDLRTPIPQTEEFYAALRVQNKPAVMVRFQDEWHGTSSNPSNFLRTQLYLRAWFDKWKTPTTVTDMGNR